ncbi:mitochondrial carrier domain-containing protein [Pelagophyceae sp. CCMP2097]|nr:mitochondrial carrier domain-containing protein [Pelagophyceae sp. CCMP2097]|mmetsp:Transcript_18567/g.62646  ORF Transcript_18567/g.62646 Transcript_18567/m.62646 type:complete len:347 (+) Transcript_18567:186-1226(+)
MHAFTLCLLLCARGAGALTPVARAKALQSGATAVGTQHLPRAAPRSPALTRRTLGISSLLLPAFISTAASANVAPAAVSTAATAAAQQNDFISGLAGGAAQRLVKDIVLHPIDTVKTRLQRPGMRQLTRAALLNPYAGVVAPLVVGVPAGALFFGVKDLVARQMEGVVSSEALAEALAVGVANVPYWFFRNPAELVKTRQQLGAPGGAAAVAADILKTDGPAGLYAGVTESYAYALPTDVVKFAAYRQLKASLPGSGILHKAGLGAAASALAQFATTPLDVVKTRSMDAVAAGPPRSIPARLADIVREEGLGELFAGLSPRLVRAVVSGFLQFGSYEFTKRLFSNR